MPTTMMPLRVRFCDSDRASVARRAALLAVRIRYRRCAAAYSDYPCRYSTHAMAHARSLCSIQLAKSFGVALYVLFQLVLHHRRGAVDLGGKDIVRRTMIAWPWNFAVAFAQGRSSADSPHS